MQLELLWNTENLFEQTNTKWDPAAWTSLENIWNETLLCFPIAFHCNVVLNWSDQLRGAIDQDFSNSEFKGFYALKIEIIVIMVSWFLFLLHLVAFQSLIEHHEFLLLRCSWRPSHCSFHLGCLLLPFLLLLGNVNHAARVGNKSMETVAPA